MRYICIDRRRNQYPVMMMCRLLQVSRSGYYAWRVRAESQRAKTDRELIKRIRQIHEDSDGVYGAAKIAAELNEQGYPCGRHKVARLMRIAGLKGCPKTTFKVTTQRDLSHPVADNLLEQDFTAEGPNERWASDITYISTHQGWLFLAVVMDLYSRRIVGWSMGRWINRHLVIDALNMAIGQRCPEGELLHHSDRGSQYTSDDFRDELHKHNIQCSMSARGNCYDNAVVESFFGLLKRERVNRFYNRKRRHGYLGNISPAAFEERNQNKFQTVH
jgi:transposase InsO family protein